MSETDLDLAIVKNEGLQIVSTNYWTTPRAARGYLYLSVRSRTVRVLLPETVAGDFLRETANADRAAVTLAGADSKNPVHLLWEDGTNTPFVMSLDVRQCDFVLPRSVAGRWDTLAIYVPGSAGVESVRCVRTISLLIRAAGKRIDLTAVPVPDVRRMHDVGRPASPTDDAQTNEGWPATLPDVSESMLHARPTTAVLRMTSFAAPCTFSCSLRPSILKALQDTNYALAADCVALGGDVAKIDVNGDSPLHHAAAQGCDDVIRALLARGAAVDSTNHDGQTPTFHAMHFEHFGSARLLPRPPHAA